MGAARLVQAASGDNDVAAHADDVHSNLNHTPAAAEAAQLPGTENPTVGRMSTDTPPPIVVSPHTSPEQNPT